MKKFCRFEEKLKLEEEDDEKIVLFVHRFMNTVGL